MAVQIRSSRPVRPIPRSFAAELEAVCNVGLTQRILRICPGVPCDLPKKCRFAGFRSAFDENVLNVPFKCRTESF